MPICPNCTSAQTVNNGRIHTGKQRFKCLEGGRQFVEQSSKKVIDCCSRLVAVITRCVSAMRCCLYRLLGSLCSSAALETALSCVGKETGKTNDVERFNNTLRQRVSRLVRKTLLFSKSLENHISAIWYFVHAYNKSLLV